MPLRLIRDRHPDFFRRAYKFCFERNPIEKCLSDFGMLVNSGYAKSPPKTWDEYVERGNFPVDASLYVDENGQVLADDIFRYEDFEAGIREAETRIGTKFSPITAREKTGWRRGVPSISDVTPAQRARILDAFKPSLQLVPYETGRATERSI